MAAWCTAQLHHNRNATAGIAAALMERKRSRGKALRNSVPEGAAAVIAG